MFRKIKSFKYVVLCHTCRPMRCCCPWEQSRQKPLPPGAGCRETLGRSSGPGATWLGEDFLSLPPSCQNGHTWANVTQETSSFQTGDSEQQSEAGGSPGCSEQTPTPKDFHGAGEDWAGFEFYGKYNKLIRSFHKKNTQPSPTTDGMGLGKPNTQ